jgi:hypothetical protein
MTYIDSTMSRTKPDKIDDAKAKAAIRLQIEADKVTRAAKFAREKALRDGTAIIDVDTLTTAAPVAAPTKPKANYDETRLQFKLVGGGALVKVCATSLTLEEVYREICQDGEVAAGKFEGCRLICSFPRKEYGDKEMGMTLKALNLAPSASLICQMD